MRRSREGAWIEIYMLSSVKLNAASRSREGAWIEINVTAPTTLKPYGSLPRGSVD